MSDLHARLKAALAHRYTVGSELGRGGMAVVYQAVDLKHRRTVALKVLHPDLAAALGAERFLREIEIAARLNHPHILPLFDSGEADGILYYVMPKVEGESLEDRLERERQLPMEDAIAIASEVADGLAYAHGQGVVHRDIKPGNILLTGGHAVIADFGIARAISEAGGDRLTETGLAVGSPVYMSPEQALGAEVVDGRSDLYALACVVYEMLAGEPPFTGSTPQMILARKSAQSPPSLQDLRETVPPGLDRVVRKAMARLPADRQGTVEEFAVSLRASRTAAEPVTRRRTIAAGVLTAIVLIAAAVALGRGAGDASGGADLRSIAVMPFAIQSAKADQDVTFFADGVHSDLLTQLSKIDSLTVVSRTSVVSLGESGLSVAEIAERLGVATVLTGSIQRAGHRIRVNVQLIDTDKGDHLWAETYDEDFTMENIFAIQSDMARQIARALRMTLTPQAEGRLTARPTGTLEAYQHYVRGRFVANDRPTREGLEEAVALFRKAIEADSGYAMAYTGLAAAYFQLWHLDHLPPEETLPHARAAVGRALALDDLLAEAHLALGNLLRAELRFDEAEKEFERALALNPGLAEVHKEYAHLLLEQGRFDEAVPAARRAVEIDPLSLPNRRRLVGILLFTRRYDEGIIEGWRLVELEPDNEVSYYYLGALYAMQGRYPEAIDALERSIELGPTFGFNVASLASVYARSGHRDRALEILRDVPERGSLLKEIALVHAELGDVDRAFEYLERAYEEDPGSLSFLNADPQADPQRADPRFENLVGRLGMGPR